MSTFCYRLGYLVGTIVRELRDGLRMDHCSTAEQSAQFERPTTPVHEEFDTVPAIVRKGVDLDGWYETNLNVEKPKPRARKPKAPRAKSS